MLTKICGITRLEDAEYALSCGANALGFIFWPRSPRAIDPQRAKAIVAALPSVVTVGVFVNQALEDVDRMASTVPLGAVQLHGEESVAYAGALRHPVLKAIALAGATEKALETWPASTLMLLDATDPERRGGTGRTIDWQRAAVIARRRRIVLAGGLTPENVAEAITMVRPFGIDVSSGVEERPGVKDRGRVRALFEAIADANKAETALGGNRPAAAENQQSLGAWGLESAQEARRR